MLIDLLGNVRAMLQNSYRYPAPRETVEFVSDSIKRMRAGLTSTQNARIAGLGIAMPFELWNWADTAGAPRDIMDQWRHRDIRADIRRSADCPVYLQNDATAACGAELVFGQTGGLRDFIYFYIGAFAGGGIVLNGGLFGGHSGNAGAVGSMPVPGPRVGRAQLIDIASLAILEKALNARGIDANYLWTRPEEWRGEEPEFETWFQTAGRALAYSIVSASAVIDFEAAIIDGWMPADAAPAARRGGHRGAAAYRRRGAQRSGCPRGHRRHSCARARRRQPSPVGTFPDRLRRATELGLTMLIGIPDLLGPDFLATLRAMGHGDELAIVDANYPAVAHGHRVLRADGHRLIDVIDAVLAVLPVDDAVPQALFRAAPAGDAEALDPVHVEIVAACAAPRSGPRGRRARRPGVLRSGPVGLCGGCDGREAPVCQFHCPQGRHPPWKST